MGTGNIAQNTSRNLGGRLTKNNFATLSCKFDEFYKNKDNYNTILFGAGSNCKTTIDLLKSENINMPLAICDNDSEKFGKNISNIQIISVKEAISKFTDLYFIITPLDFLDEIYNQLIKFLPEERIIFDTEIFIFFHHKRLYNVCSLLSDDKSKEVFSKILQLKTNSKVDNYANLSTLPQYFQDDIYKIKKDEVFLDVGAFTGDTIEVLEKITNGKYKKVIACEPNKDSYLHIEKMMETNSKIELIKKGISDKKEILSFNSSGGSSGFKENGDIKIEVDSIDNLIKEEITFIKMDIEGFEMNALEGAINTIKKYKPTLAICIYHKYTDFVDIPEFIINLNLGYKLYIRHHSNIFSETVLYALSK